MNKTVILIFCGMTFSAGGAAHADLHVYPTQGQSQAQQNRDRWECHQWAIRQTGIDPIAMAEQELKPTSGQGESVAQGVRRGLFHGLIAGAIRGGDFARTTPMGAGIGALIALRRHRKAMEKQHQEYMKAYNERASKLKTYDRAFSACLKGRGYSVS